MAYIDSDGAMYRRRSSWLYNTAGLWCERGDLFGTKWRSGIKIVLVMKIGSIQMPTKKRRAGPGERMSAKNNNGLPAYQRIQSGIRKRIEAAPLRSRDAVTSEPALPNLPQSRLITPRHPLSPPH